MIFRKAGKDVAERLFRAKGFDSTSITDMLNEIGIARGTLYYHFKFSLNVSDGDLGQELLKQAHKPQNALMHQKMEKCLLPGINRTPI